MRRGLGRRRWRRIRLRRATPLMGSWPGLRLRSNALRFMRSLGLCCRALLRCRLAWLPSVTGLLGLLGLLRLVCLLGLSLLEGKNLLRLKLGLPMWHLPEVVHL